MIAKTPLQKMFAVAVIVGSLTGACGYRPVVARGPLAEPNGVNVTLFANRSYRAGVEAVLARDLVDEFALRTGGKVLPADQAQTELIGVIVSYAYLPISYSALNTIKEYKTVISVQATLREQQSKRVLWKGDLTEEQSFPVNANLALQQNAEEAAAAKVCRRLSEEIWQKIGERF